MKSVWLITSHAYWYAVIGTYKLQWDAIDLETHNTQTLGKKLLSSKLIDLETLTLRLRVKNY